MSAKSVPPPVRRGVDADAVPGLRRAGRALVASGAAFLLGLICVVVGGIVTGSADAEDAAAAQRGVNVADLPAAVLAEIHRGDSWVGSVLVGIPFVAAAVLLVLGVRAAVRDVPRPFARGIAVALAVVAGVAWLLVQVADLFYVSALDPVNFPAVVATTATGCAAVTVTAVVLRGRGVVRRTASVIAILGAAATVGAFLFVPPFAPYLLGLVLGVPLARTRPSTTM